MNLQRSLPARARDARAGFTDALAVELSRRLGTSPLPKYAQLAQVIEEMIRDGRLAPGQQLPAEARLAATTPLSLGTVQKAMAALERHGLVTREHGKGTFVRRSPAELRALWHFRFVGADGAAILPVYPRVLEIARIDDPGPWSRFLDARDGCIRVTRMVDVDKAFSFVSEYYVAAGRCRALLDIAPEALDGVHLRELLKDRCGIDTVRVVEQVACERFPRAVATRLEMGRNAVGLACRIFAYGFKDRPASYQVLYVPPHAPPLEIRERQP